VKYPILFAALFLFVTSLCDVSVMAQSATWLDQNPIRNWNTTSMRLPRPDRRARPQVAECRTRGTRPPTFAQDRALIQNGMWPVGPAQVYGATVVITAAKNFDGMCRPLEFQTFVFDANRLVGTFSPEPMNSRTDGAIVYVRMFGPSNFEVEYSRYAESDALCCPSKTQKVRFEIVGTGARGVLTPEGAAPGGSPGGGTLAGSKWRWESIQTPVRNVTVNRPNDYTVEFMPDGGVVVKSDCNTGRGRYTSSGSDLTFSAIAMTRRACLRGSQDNLFNRSLAAARTFRRDGDKLSIDLFADSGTMHFVQNELGRPGS
jgi:heat shock protein HslJ